MTAEQIDVVESLERDLDRHFFQILMEKKLFSVDIVKELLEDYYGIVSCDVMEKQISADLIDRFSHGFVTRYVLMPLELANGELLVAMANPFDVLAIDELEMMTNCRVKPVFADSQDIRMLIYARYSSSQLESIQSKFMNQESFNLNEENQIEKENVKNAPIVQFVDSILDSAVLHDASDIHIEPYENVFRVRFRIDGLLSVQKVMRLELLPNVISRIKVIGGMNISDRRLPQDGHFRMSRDDVRVEFRVNTIPTTFGEKAEIRIIYHSKSIVDKSSLGFFEEDLKQISSLLKNPHGAILVTGPTGSGKNTTLASFISELNKEDVNITTVEDPVENTIPGVNQIQVNSKIGLGFAEILTAVLRQDPDIMMIGEIRDSETAKIAIRASLTGHLVLSTLHTNDAVSSIIRLIDMGIAPYAIPASLKGVISQRLVRKICEKCKTEYAISQEDCLALDLSMDMKAFVGTGCASCQFTGYKGRFAVCEILTVNYKVKEMLENPNVSKLKAYFASNGMVTLRENILKNVILGNTSIAEMYKVVYGSEE